MSLKPSQRVADALYNFPLYSSDYALVGSGPMALRDMRDVGDLDIFCTTQGWFELVNDYDFAVTTTSGTDLKRRCDPPIASKCIEGVEVNCFFDWRIRWGDMLINVTEEIEAAEQVWITTSAGRYFDVRAMRLERLIAWKHSAGRDKDFRDIAQIAAYLTRDVADE